MGGGRHQRKGCHGLKASETVALFLQNQTRHEKENTQGLPVHGRRDRRVLHSPVQRQHIVQMLQPSPCHLGGRMATQRVQEVKLP